MEQFNGYANQIIELAMNYTPKLLLALLVLTIGWWAVNQITKILLKAVEKSNVDSPEIKSFLGSLVSIGLKILLLLSVAGIVGIETTSFVGIIAAMGFALGLALQGNLSNFAAGIMILLLRPFKVGDEVKIQGNWAYVKEIQIFHTILSNFDRTEVIIPNSIIMGDTIENLSNTPTRSISIKFMVPFEEDLDRFIKVLTEAAYSIPEVDQSTEPFYWISDQETHYIQLHVGFDTTQEGFWNTDFKVRKAIIDAFVEYNIKVVYPEGVDFGQFGQEKQAYLNKTQKANSTLISNNRQVVVS